MDALTMFSGTYMLCVGIGFIIDILIAVYMYKDAEKRGKSGVVWLLIGLIFGLLGLIIWLIIRPPEPSFYQQQQYPQPPPQ